MPASTFTMSTGCQSGAGFVDILTLTGGAAGADYAYELAGGPLAAGGVSAPDLPLRLSGLADGPWSLFVGYTNPDGSSGGATRTFTVGCAGTGTAPGALALDFVRATDETAARNDGTATIQARGGLAPLTAAINALGRSLPAVAGNAVTFAGVPAGTYEVRVTDANAAHVEGTITVTAYSVPVPGCTDPLANNYNPLATQDDGSCAYTPPPRFAHFVFSPAQSLRFVQAGEGFDSRLFEDEHPLNLNNPGYCQQVEKNDTLLVQWQSNYNGAHTVRVLPCAGGTAVASPIPTRVVVGAGTSPAFEAYARPNGTLGGTRLYFNDDALPLPFAIGMRVTLTNAGTLNGTYPVADVREDPAAHVPYLLLSRPYPGGAQRIDLSLTTPYALQAFDTWQVVLPFAAISEGCYQVQVSATDSAFGTATALSEPLDVATTHRDTVLVVYRNYDNAFGLNYTAGLVNRLRVVARFFERDTPTQKTTLRESTGRLTLLAAEAQRRIKLTVFQQPDWMHEKLAVAFCHDFVRVNGLKGIAEEKYDYPPTPSYTLSNGSTQVEQEDFLGAGNRDDVGDVDAGNFLLVDNQYLVINP